MESLEARQLLAFTSLGFSLPDLTVEGLTAPVASWGGPLKVSVDVHNRGGSTIIEPLSLTPGARSTADAPPSTVGVYLSKKGHFPTHQIKIATIQVPGIPQNSEVVVSPTITLPPRPLGFPGDGGQVFIEFHANDAGTIAETDDTNNSSRPQPLLIGAPLPELAAVAFDVPPTIQPGDVIQPNIRIANIGVADTAPQGPVLVTIFESKNADLTQGSKLVSFYEVANIPALSRVPSGRKIFGDVTLDPPGNVVTIHGKPVQIPFFPHTYYLGVVIDPQHKIRQLHDLGHVPGGIKKFELAKAVGPPIRSLPPAAAVLVKGGLINAGFPIPAGQRPPAVPSFPIVTPTI